MHHATRRTLWSGLIALTLLAGATPGQAAGAFDGNWNIAIITQAGACDPTYSFGVQVADGRLNGANGALIGLVSANGGVTVQMGGGERRGTASGRLKGNSGAGRWSGNATGASCRGRWTATRG